MFLVSIVLAWAKLVLWAALIFQAFTYLLWLFDKRRRGRAEPTTPESVWIRALLEEFLAFALTLFVWPLGLLPNRVRRQPSASNSKGDGRPVVLLHGWGMNRAYLFLLARRLRRRGRLVYAFNYSVLGRDTNQKAEEIAVFMRRVHTLHSQQRIDMIGHGLGGVLARAALTYHGIDEWVGNVVTLGTPHRGTALAVLFRRFGLLQLRPGSRFLERLEEDERLPPNCHAASITSPFDAIAFPCDLAAWPKAFTVLVEHTGHSRLVYCPRVFGLVVENLDHDVASEPS